MGRKRATALLVLTLLAGAACEGPIVARSPEALYTLAKEQLNNSQYRAAADTLQRIAREAPESELGRRAAVLRIALLGGLARGYQTVGKSYLAGHKQTGAPEIRVTGMDYFNRARGRSVEMLEAANAFTKLPTAPLRVDYFPVAPAWSGALEKIQRGRTLPETEVLQAENAEVRRGLAELLAELGGAEGDIERLRARGPVVEIDPALFFLESAREVVRMISLYQPEALNEPQMLRLYHQHAATLARHAAELARARGDQKTVGEAEKLIEESQKALAKR